MHQCIIYLRVSTRQQAFGHGLVRQLETCQDFAKQQKLWVRAVYTDIASGAGKLPNRSLAVAESKKLGIPILVETRCRWSRGPSEDTNYRHVLQACPLAKQAEEVLADMLTSDDGIGRALRELLEARKKHLSSSCQGGTDG